MKAWELLKHLEEGGEIRSKIDGRDDYYRIRLGDLSGWDYDPIRCPEGWEIAEQEEFDSSAVGKERFWEEE